MRSAGSVLLGEQRPRVSSVPSFATSAGIETVELVESTGRCLDDWQKYTLWASLGEDPAGNWTSFEVALIVARQNGKGDVLMARELGGLFLFGEQLIVHTAHEYKTAAEAFLRIRDVIDNCDDLRRQVKAIRTSHGEEGIELLNGARLRFLARSKGSGRGFTGDCLICDECMFLDAAPVAALLPTLSARPNPQFWLAGSAGMETSEHLNSVRVRALAGGDPSLCYLEWSAPDDVDPADPRGWAQANPALNIRIPQTFVEREQRTMPAREFARERNSIWSDDRAEAIFDMALWDRLGDPDSDVDRVWFGISMAGDRSAAAIGAAGRRADGFSHVEVIEHANGVRWVADRALQLQKEWGAPVVLDPGSPAGALIPALQEAGVDLTLITTRELGQACGAFYDDVVAEHLRHLGDPVLTTALLAAKQQPMGDAWKFSLKNSTGDISPLLAVTLAKFGLDSDVGNEPANNVW